MMAALAASGIPVQYLNIYNGVERCSVACNELSAVNFEFNALATTLASLKSLAVSFSDRVVNELTEDLGLASDSADEWEDCWEHELREPEDIEHEVSQKSTFSGLPAMLQLCRGLESLELHHYQLKDPDPLDWEPRKLHLNRERFFSCIANNKMDLLPPLKRVVLRGFRVKSADVLALLHRLRPTLEDLSLRHLIVIEGATFESIFNYCTSDEAGLERLYLDHLLEPVATASGRYNYRQLLYFTGEPNQVPRLRRRDLPRYGSNTVDRVGATQIRRPIPYISVNIPVMDRSIRPTFWPNRRTPHPPWLYDRYEYGPP
ncbi:hypothetical protein BJX64DRAFT_247638 [Aspergillus heterothallicus]